MSTQGIFSLTCSLLILLGLVGRNVVVVVVAGVTPSHETASFNRSSFPGGFLFGTASSAYQYEGAADEGGRGPSIWDTFTHRYPERIRDGSNGDVAIDSYSRYKEDVALMKDVGMDAYRFSISWSRILPNGKLSGGVNKEGIEYYNNLIDELQSKGIQPFVTLFHWDLPQALEDEYGGFLSPKIVNHFREYAEICFKEFGDRVKHWITLNEPSAYSEMGYTLGIFAPGRCSNWINPNCRGGDSATEPYIVTHHQLLAHAAAVKLYKDEYQAKQKGLIGITLVSTWFVPLSNAKRHRSAAARAIDFQLGWYMDPLTRGDYPHSMNSLLGNRLPKFTEEQARMLNGSFDFLGLNYYTANYTAHMPPSNPINASYLTDARALLSNEKKGIQIGPKAASNWLCIYPKGLRKLLLHIKTKYNHPPIYITENGVDEHNNATLSLQEALADTVRVDFYSQHLSFLQKAIKDGVNVKGYFAWSLLDNFEWSSGYTVRFGMHYVDYKNGLKKYPKLSARWFKNFLKK